MRFFKTPTPIYQKVHTDMVFSLCSVQKSLVYKYTFRIRKQMHTICMLEGRIRVFGQHGIVSQPLKWKNPK